MRTVRDVLRDADPLSHEPYPLDEQRARLRQAVVATPPADGTSSSAGLRTPVALLITATLLVAGIVAIGSQIWSQGGATVQAAIRFEVRLAEDHAALGLREARVTGSDRVVYLHPEIIVSNGDIAQTSVVQGDEPPHFGVVVQFTEAGAQKMRQATTSRAGGLVAILVDGDVVAAPVVRGPISTSAVISGAYTEAEARRIADGIRIR
jgi:hypothetical protein